MMLGAAGEQIKAGEEKAAGTASGEPDEEPRGPPGSPGGPAPRAVCLASRSFALKAASFAYVDTFPRSMSLSRTLHPNSKTF